MELLLAIQPEFLDFFGLGASVFVIAVSLWGLSTGKPIPKWTLILLFTVGILNLAVDGLIVFLTYLS